jgi:cyanophycin synthetase
VSDGSLTANLISSLGLYFKVRGKLYHRTSTKRLVAQRRKDFYVALWEEAAQAAGCSTRRVQGQLLEISCNGTSIRVNDNLTSLDDPVTLQIAGDKPLVYRLLSDAGIPVPRHVTCGVGDLATAWEFVSSLRAPAVVKPAKSTAGGVGIGTGITDRLDLVTALGRAAALSAEVVVEEQLAGDVYRLLYFDGELLDAVVRRPPVVHGDGRSTIKQLIQRENDDRLARGIEGCQSLVKTDWELHHRLRLHGYTLRSIPGAGEVVQLKNVVNDNRRDDNESAVERLCPEVLEVGVRAASVVGARLAGVDLITPDIGRPLEDVGGAVIEVNTTPGYYYHYMKREGRTPVASMVVQRVVAADR